MSGDDKNNPYAAPKADIASSPLLINGPGSPVKAVLIGAASCIAVQVVVGIMFFALGGIDIKDGQAQIPQPLYALGVLLSIPVNAWAGAKTAHIANAGEYRWAALAGLLVTGFLIALNSIGGHKPDGYEIALDMLDHLLTVPAFLGGAWWKLRHDQPVPVSPH